MPARLARLVPGHIVQVLEVYTGVCTAFWCLRYIPLPGGAHPSAVSNNGKGALDTPVLAVPGTLPYIPE
eukprot:3188998-Pyramimonas_sp.AAC.1